MEFDKSDPAAGRENAETEPESNGLEPRPPRSEPPYLTAASTHEEYGVPVLAEIPSPSARPNRPPPREPVRRRKIILPLFLFAATCLSTFFAGGQTESQLFSVQKNGDAFLDYRVEINVNHGLVYMAAVMGILLAHEMGHFLVALVHRVPASLPFFLPMPITPFGTMGAVIGMQGSRADRRQLFDIGLAGPWVGLFVALPVVWYGIKTADPFVGNVNAAQHYPDPLLFKLLIAYLRPELAPGQELWLSPLLRAGWLGMLVTGLNMLPLSQLDGGHVAYALFGKRAHLLAKAVVAGAVGYMWWSNDYRYSLMLFLVLIIGVSHPPTANDRAPLGWPRRAIGLASLAIPIFCLTGLPNF